MANDLDYFYKLHKNSYADSEAAAIQAAKDAANANIKLIEDNYGTQIADAKAAYDPLFRQNEIQRAVNERYLERRAAEMGLTDSGLSRTQQTANRLSYSNQNAEYMRQRQKAVDTLKAAMDAKILKQNTTLNTNIAGIKTTYVDKRTADAVSSYNKYIKESTKAAKTTDDQFNDLYNQIYKERRDSATKDSSGNLTYNNNPIHLDMIYKYQKQNGLPTDSLQMKRLLYAAGISAEDYNVKADEYAAQEQKLAYDALDDVALRKEITENGSIQPTGTANAKFILSQIKNGYALTDSVKTATVYSKIKKLQEKIKNANSWDLFWNGNKWNEELNNLISETKNLPKVGQIDIKNEKSRDEILNTIRQSGLSLSEQYYVATQLGLQNYYGGEKDGHQGTFGNF